MCQLPGGQLVCHERRLPFRKAGKFAEMKAGMVRSGTDKSMNCTVCYHDREYFIRFEMAPCARGSKSIASLRHKIFVGMPETGSWSVLENSFQAPPRMDRMHFFMAS